ITGWPVAWKWAVACLLGESSQQPTCPHVLQMRKCSQRLPLLRHSSQPSALGVTSCTPAMWLQPFVVIAHLTRFVRTTLAPHETYSAGFAASPRYPCSAATTCAPSPIAPPTRLTEPERTSPTANTPGTVVSSGAACRLPLPSAGTPV